MQVKVGVLGHFGEGLTLLNGQTIKTKIVTEELQRQFGQEQVLKIDTHGGWKTLLKAPFQVFRALKRSENVLIFPAHNGLRVYAPLLSFQKRFFKGRKLHYSVIGGWLPEFLTKRKSLAKKLKHFDGIYVETQTMKKALEEQGFANVYVIPNCKKLTVLSNDELVYSTVAPYKLCTFSRVMKEKGIDDAVRAVISANEQLGYQAFALDIYGQVDANQTEWFDDLQKSFPEYVRYGGLVPFDKSVEVLKGYYALLFPTYYEGEGFAGTLVDAFGAGVPVIASDWKYNPEIVDDRVNGIVYPLKEQLGLKRTLLEVINDTTVLNAMKTNCLQKAAEYIPETALQALFDKL